MLLAILSISLVVNLPGLAISPIMGKLNEVFPECHRDGNPVADRCSRIFVTIPLYIMFRQDMHSEESDVILGIGLGIYALTGVLYFFAKSMIELILAHAVCSVWAAVLSFRLRQSLISQYFVGKGVRVSSA